MMGNGEVKAARRVRCATGESFSYLAFGPRLSNMKSCTRCADIIKKKIISTQMDVNQ